jgi:hypothetical protein
LRKERVRARKRKGEGKDPLRVEWFWVVLESSGSIQLGLCNLRVKKRKGEGGKKNGEGGKTKGEGGKKSDEGGKRVVRVEKKGFGLRGWEKKG